MKKIVRAKARKSTTAKILDQTYDAYVSLTEAITGIAASDKKEYFLSLGHLLQRVRSGRFLQTFMNEWNAYREKGKVKDGYEDTRQCMDCLQELLESLDKDPPDEQRLILLKKILLVASTETISNRDSALPLEFMRICRGLTSGEILVLEATNAVAQSGRFPQNTGSAEIWLRAVAEYSVLKYPELIEIHERGLITKNLLVGRIYPDNSGVRWGDHFRLTDLALEIISFIKAYDSILAA